jgi:hypothetical protein
MVCAIADRSSLGQGWLIFLDAIAYNNYCLGGTEREYLSIRSSHSDLLVPDALLQLSRNSNQLRM